MTGKLQVMNYGGHDTLEWDTDHPETVAEVRAKFDAIIGNAFAYKLKDGEVTGLKEFTDSTAETADEVIVTPRFGVG